MPFGGPILCTFKAQIKPGVTIFLDHGWYKWPDCPTPRVRPGTDPDMIFDVEMHGIDWFDCKAQGYGADYKDGYGNGSVHVYRIEDLLVDAKAHRKALAVIKAQLIEKRAAKRADTDKIEIEMAHLDAAIAALP